MPRTARKRSGNGMYHILVQGPDRQHIFQDTSSKIQYLSTIRKYQNEGLVRLRAWCILENSAHLIIQEEKDTVSEFMRRTSISFVHWFNTEYHRRGPLFRDRYASEIIPSQEELTREVRYIHQLPVRYGRATAMEDYPWSSFSYYLSSELETASDPVYLQLNGYDYRQYMNDFWMDQYLAETRGHYGRK